MSQQSVSIVERGQLERVGLSTARRIARALEASLLIVIRWRGGELARLLDEDHAAVVELVAARLRAEGWDVLVERTFNHFGERGAVDVVGWQAGSRALLLVEVKSRLTDLQELFASFGRKVRLVPGILARELGWQATVVGSVLVVPDTTTARKVVARHGATFAAALPGRARDVHAWLRVPRDPLAAVWFLSLTTTPGGNRVTAAPRTIRRRRGGMRVAS